MPDETPDRGLNAFARALAVASPHPGRLDRDALLFAAGRAAQARQGRAWRLSTAALALLSAGLGAALAVRPAPAPGVVEVERVVYVPAPTPPAPQQPPAMPEALSPPVAAPAAAVWAEGLRQRERALREGIAGLPPAALAWSAPLPPPLSERDVPELSALHRFPANSGDRFR